MACRRHTCQARCLGSIQDKYASGLSAWDCGAGRTSGSRWIRVMRELTALNGATWSCTMFAYMYVHHISIYFKDTKTLNPQ